MKKTLTCFGCGEKGHVLDECPKTSKKERADIWETRNKGFRKDDASAAASTKTKTKTTTGVINQAVERNLHLKKRVKTKRELPTPRHASSI